MINFSSYKQLYKNIELYESRIFTQLSNLHFWRVDLDSSAHSATSFTSVGVARSPSKDWQWFLDSSHDFNSLIIRTQSSPIFFHGYLQTKDSEIKILYRVSVPKVRTILSKIWTNGNLTKWNEAFLCKSLI